MSGLILALASAVCTAPQFSWPKGSDQCVNVCPPPLITDLKNGSCYDQPTGCSTVTLLFLKDKNACVSACPKGFKEEVINNVASCVYCPKFVSNDKKQCVDICPYGANAELVCNAANCTIANNKAQQPDGQCIDKAACTKSLYVVDDTVQMCIDTCPPDSYLVAKEGDNTYSTCSKCTSLNTPYIEKGVCVASCSQGYYIDISGKFCVEKCPLLSSDSKSCVQKCDDGFYPSTNTSNQVQCHQVKDCSADQTGNTVAQWETCISADKCVGFLQSLTDKKLQVCDQFCIKRNEIAQPVEGKTYKQCLLCPEGLFLQLDRTTCLPGCQPGFPMHDQKLCIKSAAECTAADGLILSADKNSCGKTCPPGEILSQNVCTKCTDATPLSDSAGTKCVGCLDTQIVSLTENKCVDTVAECKGNLQEDQKKCAPRCPQGQFEAFKNSETQIQCKKCPAEKPISTLDGKGCSETCVFGIAKSDGSCFTNKDDCKELLSSNGLICAAHCPPSEYPGTKGVNYTPCTKCSVGTYVKSTNDDCINTCPTDQIVDKRYNQCIDKASCTGAFFEKENACLKECPPGYQTIKGTPNTCQACPDGQYTQTDSSGVSSCVSSCAAITNVIEKKCLESLDLCKGGFISSDGKKCDAKCPTSELVDVPPEAFEMFLAWQKLASSGTTGTTPAPADPYALLPHPPVKCVVKCQETKFTSGDGKACFPKCPLDHITDITTMACRHSGSTCPTTSYTSADGKSCLAACPDLQTADANKRCVPCKDFISISADNKPTCVTACPTGTYTVLDGRFCAKSSAECKGLIVNETDKTCSSRCPLGQFMNADGTACISQCSGVISVDGRTCVQDCNATEAKITNKEGVTVCVFCPLGKSDDGTKCLTACVSPNIYLDVESNKCVPTCSKKISSDKKRCSDKCLFPDLAQGTECKSQCDSGYVFSPESGCVLNENCTTYISSDGTKCVKACIDIFEITSSDVSNNKCQKCDAGLFPKYTKTTVETVTTQKIECVADDMTDRDAQKEKATQMKDFINNMANIPQEQKKEIKEQLKSVSTSLGATLKSVNSATDLTKEQKKVEIKNIVNSVLELAKSFLSKLTPTTQTDTTSVVDDIFVAATTEFKVASAKKKDGFKFKLNFNSNEFDTSNTSTTPNLLEQQPTDGTVSQSQFDFETLSATNLKTNPYCTDDTKCGTSSLFMVEYTLASNSAARLLATASTVPTFTTTFTTTADKISKSVCVTYNEVDGTTTKAVTSPPDMTTNTITCTFTTNASLYYDSTCTYLDATTCQTNTNTTVDVTSATKVEFSLVFTSLLLLIAQLF